MCNINHEYMQMINDRMEYLENRIEDMERCGICKWLRVPYRRFYCGVYTVDAKIIFVKEQMKRVNLYDKCHYKGCFQLTEEVSE